MEKGQPTDLKVSLSTISSDHLASEMRFNNTVDSIYTIA